MKSKRTLIILVLVFALLLGGAALLYDQLAGDYAPEQLTIAEGEQVPAAGAQSAPEQSGKDSEDALQIAPDFTVYNAEGDAVKLSDYFGKPIVLNFWARWCGPCQMEMPDFQAAFEALGENVQFLMVNMTDGARETVDTAADFIAEKEYTFPVLFDTDSDAAITYSVYSLPSTYFIDAEGHAVAKATGAIDAETLQRGIDMVYSE